MAAKDETDKSTEIMAALGVGMVPAAMAVLMPMVLGRRKRDTSRLSQNYFHHIDPVQFRLALEKRMLLKNHFANFM